MLLKMIKIDLCTWFKYTFLEIMSNGVKNKTNELNYTLKFLIQKIKQKIELENIIKSYTKQNLME